MNDRHKKRGGFEDIPKSEIGSLCLDPEHAPPMHLWIPPGKQYRHICPSCGHEVVMRAPQVTMENL